MSGRYLENEGKKTEVSGFIIERTAKRMKQYFQQTLSAANTGVTADQWIILQLLNIKDGLSQLEIAQKSFKDAPTVTRIIDLLCKKQLTQRAVDPADRRRFKIMLTAKGREKIKEVLPIVRAFRIKGWGDLTEIELDNLVVTLNKIFSNLEKNDI